MWTLIHMRTFCKCRLTACFLTLHSAAGAKRPPQSSINLLSGHRNTNLTANRICSSGTGRKTGNDTAVKMVTVNKSPDHTPRAILQSHSLTHSERHMSPQCQGCPSTQCSEYTVRLSVKLQVLHCQQPSCHGSWISGLLLSLLYLLKSQPSGGPTP